MKKNILIALLMILVVYLGIQLYSISKINSAEDISVETNFEDIGRNEKNEEKTEIGEKEKIEIDEDDENDVFVGKKFIIELNEQLLGEEDIQLYGKEYVQLNGPDIFSAYVNGAHLYGKYDENDDGIVCYINYLKIGTTPPLQKVEEKISLKRISNDEIEISDAPDYITIKDSKNIAPMLSEPEWVLTENEIELSLKPFVNGIKLINPQYKKYSKIYDKYNSTSTKWLIKDKNTGYAYSYLDKNFQHILNAYVSDVDNSLPFYANLYDFDGAIKMILFPYAEQDMSYIVLITDKNTVWSNYDVETLRTGDYKIVKKLNNEVIDVTISSVREISLLLSNGQLVSLY